MAANITSSVDRCGITSIGNVAITLLFAVSPIHILVLKVLAVNLRFDMPRHIILFCLSASDSFQILVTALCMTIFKVANLSIGSAGCSGARFVMQANAAATLVVSSFTLLALSIERYIVCFYCYRFHEILTKKRIVIAQILILIFGIIAAVVVAAKFEKGAPGILFSATKGYFKGLMLIVTFPVSLALIFIQGRLLLLSRQKLSRVVPGASNVGNNNVEVGRLRQLKITFVASAVVLTYLISMMPGSCIILAHWFHAKSKPALGLQSAALSLGMVNTLANPLIYGLGMADIRQAVKRELKRIFRYITSKVGVSQDL